MKKAVFYSLMLLIGFASCQKQTSIESPVTGNFTAKVEGAKWSALVSKQGASILGGIINITGISADNKEISITITDSVVGTYRLTQASTSFAAYADMDSSGHYAFSTNQGRDSTQAGGVVTIVQVDRLGQTLSGTFSFKVFRDLDGRKKSITNGVFTRIPYVTSLPATAATDTLKASIDGKAWTAGNIQATVAGGQLTIIGASSNATQTIGLLMPATTTPGSYALDGSNPAYLGAYTILGSSTSTGLISTKGTLTVSQNNTSTKRIRGSFQFTAADPSRASTATHGITNGVFSVYYGP